METKPVMQNIQEFIQKEEVKRYFIVALGILFLLLLLLIPYTAASFTSTKIYEHTKIGNVEVSRMKKDWAIEKLVNYYDNAENTTLTLKVNNFEEKFTFKDIGVTYDFNKAVEDAYKLGREGGFFKRLIDIVKLDLNEKIVDLPVSYDVQKLKGIIDRLDKNVATPVKDDSYILEGDRLVFSYGYEGVGINKEKAEENILKKIKKGEGGVISFEVEKIKPKELTAADIPTEPKDATYVVQNFREIKFIPEVYGLEFDKDKFNRLRKENELNKSEFSIAVEKTAPKVKVDELKAMMFLDTLGNYETYYGSSPANRKANVSLAASKIGDVILGPGQEFSYNTIVGPRTVDRGFKLAHAYSNGKVVDDVGGGICQVSSTLYNAVLRADLAITQRRNHMFTVSYAPAGMDATVNYGTLDFRFKNNTDWPIKIINNTTPSNVAFIILGTNKNKEKTVEFRQETLKVIPQTVKTILDNTMYEGKTKVEQNGSNGYVVNVFKIIKINGEIVGQELIHKDTYSPLEKTIKKGTKPVPQTPVPNTGTPQEPVPQTNNTTNIDIPVVNEEGPPPVLQ